MRYFVISAALGALAACSPTVPDSAAGVDSGAGVGFGSYTEYQKASANREAQLQGQYTATAPVTQTSTGATKPASGSGDLENLTERSATQAAVDANSGVAPINASPSNPAPAQVDTAKISDENNFERVGTRRSIEDDAALIASNRAQYQQIQPTALPTRASTSSGGIVEYALSTTHPVGTKIHKRSGFGGAAKFTRNCAKFQSSDMAQAEFLAKGGPSRDRLGIDPDGDGYACAWNPVPFRSAVSG